MSFDLTNKNISDTFQNLLQKTGSQGHLYDLVGRKVDNLTIGGTLTAHSYITSESIVNTSSGSTSFGNTTDDTHKLFGRGVLFGDNQLAQVGRGWISSSYTRLDAFSKGTVSSGIPIWTLDQIGSNETPSGKFSLYTAASEAVRIVASADSHTYLGFVNKVGIGWAASSNQALSSKLQVNGDFTVTHITASGNISSSGIIQGKINSSDTNVDASHYMMLQTGADTVPFISNGWQFNPNKDILTVGDPDATNVSLDGTGGHITASGNISASGDFYGEDYFIEGKQVLDYVGASGKIRFGNATQKSRLRGATIELGGTATQHVTASGNISASGGSITGLNVKGTNSVQVGSGPISLIAHTGNTNNLTTLDTNGLYIQSHITASGNISSSGTITANQYGGDVSGSSTSTGSFGRLEGDGSGLSNVATSFPTTAVISSSNDLFIGSTAGTFVSASADGAIEISGSTNGILEINGNITSSGQLSIGNQGSTTGHITASGDISASGYVYAERVYVGQGDQTRLAEDPAGHLYINTPTHIFGAITASGNISSSGTIRAQDTVIDDLLTVSRIRSSGNTIADHLDIQVPIRVNTHITASGNISSSGNFMGSNIGEISLNYIPITPNDFNLSAQTNRGHALATAHQAGKAQSVEYNDVYATKIIPNGFTAVSASLFGSDVTDTVKWYSSSIDVGTTQIVSTGTIEAASGTGSAFTFPVVGDGKTYVICEWDPTTFATDYIYGGKIYIKPT